MSVTRRKGVRIDGCSMDVACGRFCQRSISDRSAWPGRASRGLMPRIDEATFLSGRVGDEGRAGAYAPGASTCDSGGRHRVTAELGDQPAAVRRTGRLRRSRVAGAGRMVDEDDPGRLCPRHRGRHDPREAQLTPAVYRHGLGVPLPETVRAGWRARPDSNRRSPA